MKNTRPTLPVAAIGLACASTFASTAPASAASRASRSTTINVIAGFPTEFKFAFRFPARGRPGRVQLGTVVFKVRNGGKLAHSFEVCSTPGKVDADSCAGKSTPHIAPGKSATLSFIFRKKGTYEYLCTLPGHAASGMKGPLTVG